MNRHRRRYVAPSVRRSRRQAAAWAGGLSLVCAVFLTWGGFVVLPNPMGADWGLWVAGLGMLWSHALIGYVCAGVSLSVYRRNA